MDNDECHCSFCKLCTGPRETAFLENALKLNGIEVEEDHVQN